MAKIEIPSGASCLTALELNKYRFSKGHTVITPERLRRGAGGK